MKSLKLSAVLAAAASLFAGDAFAQCAFDGPAKAYGLTTSLVRAFAGCPAGSFPAPNSQTGTGVPTCSPPYAHSPYEFDDSSYCKVRLRAKLEDPCSTGSSSPCTGITGSISCERIMQPGGNGMIPAHTHGWVLSMVVRVTLDDLDLGDMTVIDFPIRIQLKGPSGGKLIDDFRLESNTLSLDDLIPPCAEVELVSMSLQDPDGMPFAKIGGGARPRGF